MKMSFIFLFLLINLIHLLNTLNSDSFRKLYTKKQKELAKKLYDFTSNIPIKCKNKTQKECKSICYKELHSIKSPLQQDEEKKLVEKLLKVYYDKSIPEKKKQKKMGEVVVKFLKSIGNNQAELMSVGNRPSSMDMIIRLLKSLFSIS